MQSWIALANLFASVAMMAPTPAAAAVGQLLLPSWAGWGIHQTRRPAGRQANSLAILPRCSACFRLGVLERDDHAYAGGHLDGLARGHRLTVAPPGLHRQRVAVPVTQRKGRH